MPILLECITFLYLCFSPFSTPLFSRFRKHLIFPPSKVCPPPFSAAHCSARSASSLDQRGLLWPPDVVKNCCKLGKSHFSSRSPNWWSLFQMFLFVKYQHSATYHWIFMIWIKGPFSESIAHSPIQINQPTRWCFFHRRFLWCETREIRRLGKSREFCAAGNWQKEIVDPCWILGGSLRVRGCLLDLWNEVPCWSSFILLPYWSADGPLDTHSARPFRQRLAFLKSGRWLLEEKKR